MNRLLNDYVKYWASTNTSVDLAVLGNIFDNPAKA